ncbi:MAG: DUF6541 family protein [Candidatus Omnitrophota bacterium]
MNHYYLFIKLLYLAWIALLFINFSYLKSLCKNVSKKGWLLLLIIMCFGLILRVWLVPHMHHIYFDEFEHINIAENMMNYGKYFVTLEGGSGFYESYKFEFWPPGYHSLLAGTFFLFGSSTDVAFNFSAIMGGFSILVMFVAVFSLLGRQTIALYAAFLLSILPIHLKYSGSASPEITSLCFIIIGLIACLNHIRNPGQKSLNFAIISIAVIAYMRPENGLFVILLLLLLFFGGNFFAPRSNDQRFFQCPKNTKICSNCFKALGLLFVLLVPYVVHIFGIGIFVLPSPGWNQTLLEHLSAIKINAIDNIFYFFFDTYPVSVTILAILGASHLYKKHRPIFVYFIIWFFVTIAFFSLYHIGNFMFNPDSDRYALTPSIAIIIFAGFGLYELIAIFNKKKIIIFLLFLSVLTDGYACLGFSLFRTFERDVYQEYQFILKNQKIIPDDLYCISFVPATIISSIHKKAVAPFLFMENEDLPREIILFKDEWWYVHDFNQDRIEKRLREQYEFKPITELITPENKKYTFFKLKIKS